MELSVNNGANGINLLFFSDAWISNGDGHINPFLTATFAGKTPNQYENENSCSNNSLLETLKNYKTIIKDFFVIFEHVEQKSGLWREMQGGCLQPLGANPLFRQYTLGFQKVRTRDERQKVNQWINNVYPAEVECCDGKSLGQIGKGETCYLKLGNFFCSGQVCVVRQKQQGCQRCPPKYQHSFKAISLSW